MGFGIFRPMKSVRDNSPEGQKERTARAKELRKQQEEQSAKEAAERYEVERLQRARWQAQVAREAEEVAKHDADKVVGHRARLVERVAKAQAAVDEFDALSSETQLNKASAAISHGLPAIK